MRDRRSRERGRRKVGVGNKGKARENRGEMKCKEAKVK